MSLLNTSRSLEKLDSDLLRTFIAIAETGSLSRVYLDRVMQIKRESHHVSRNEHQQGSFRRRHGGHIRALEYCQVIRLLPV